MALNTRSTYTQAWTAFTVFRRCLEFNVEQPASAEQIAEFIGWLSLEGKAPATIAAYIAGISFWHKFKFATDPTNHCLVRQILKGVRRIKRQPDSRAPINDVLFEKILTVLPTLVSSDYERQLFQAAMAIGYFGFLRVSEFTAAGKFDPEPPLLGADVIFKGRSEVLLSIRRSKNNQTGPPQVVVLPSSKNSNKPCPVRILAGYKKARPPNGQSFLSHYDGSPLTRYQFQTMIKKAGEALGLEKRITAHSLRIGAATTAYSQAWPEATIMGAGRWRSAAYKRYIRVAPADSQRLTLM